MKSICCNYQCNFNLFYTWHDKSVLPFASSATRLNLAHRFVCRTAASAPAIQTEDMGYQFRTKQFPSAYYRLKDAPTIIATVRDTETTDARKQ